MSSAAFPPTGEALIVGISRRGVHVTEVADVSSCFDQSPSAPHLATTAVFSWHKFRGREHCYSGDDGSGSLRQRIVAGAISLIAYHGGDEEWLDDIRHMVLPGLPVHCAGRPDRPRPPSGRNTGP